MEMIRSNRIDCVKYFMLMQSWLKGQYYIIKPIKLTGTI
jgi:hypothetical protein